MFAELSRETRTLVQQELQLAKTELTEKASTMGKGAAFIIGGGSDCLRRAPGDRRGLGPDPDRYRSATVGSGVSRRRARGRYRLSAHSVWARCVETAGTGSAKDD